jgi:hypothetical protein
MREGAASASAGASSQAASSAAVEPMSPLEAARKKIIEEKFAFAPLCASLVAAREFSASEEEAAAATLGEATLSLIADGTVSAAEFFGANPFTGESESMFDHLGNLLTSPDRLSADETELDRLSDDIACFQALIAACKDERAHPEIQDEARVHERALPGFFVLQAACLPPEHHVESIKLVEPMLDALLERAARGEANVDEVLRDLDDAFTNRLHPDVRETIHSYLHKFTAQLSASAQKAKTAVELVHSAGLLPEEHQQASVRASLQTIAEIPDAALEHQAQVDVLAHPLYQCADALWGLHDHVFAKSAIDLLEATCYVKEELHFQQVVCKRIGQLAIVELNGRIRFASLPEDDKVQLFLKMLEASIYLGMYQMGDAAAWGRAMVPHLPDDKQQRAADMLYCVERGDLPQLGFGFY